MIKTGEIFGFNLQEALRQVKPDVSIEVPEITVWHLGGFYYRVRCGQRTLDYATSQKELDHQIAGIGSYGDVLCLHATKILRAFFPPIKRCKNPVS